MTSIPSSKWRALGLPRVDEDSLREAVKILEVPWDECIHVTATESMARLLRTSGVGAISIVDLTDVIVWDAMPERLQIPIVTFPPIAPQRESTNTGEGDPIAEALGIWRREISSVRAAYGIRIDTVLRSYLRLHAPDVAAGRVLSRSIRDFRNTLMFLIASNFRPGDFNSDNPLLKTANDAWAHLESEIPSVTNIRRDLWDFPNSLKNNSTVQEKDLRRRVDSTLTHVFGASSGRRQFLFHGFYFFTPQQWALMHLLKEHPELDLCFVIHDDGINRACETWRHYFIERWLMPRVEYLESTQESNRAAALLSALEGLRVDGDALLYNTRIVCFNNPTEFVRDWRLQRALVETRNDKPRLFAPLAEDINRVIERMSPGQTDTSVNLANLPIGQFLLSLHECVEFDANGNPELILTQQRLLDMVASGFLDSGDDVVKPSRNTPALRRALPFFSDVKSPSSWVSRAEALERLVLTEVSRFGARQSELNDIDRIATSAANELRLAPWCDLSSDEVHSVVLAIRNLHGLLEEIMAEGLRRPDNYLAWVRKRLERAMAHLEPTERSELEAKLRGAHKGLDDELDLEGIKDVVHIILGREMEFGLQDPRGEREWREVSEIRSLDTLGFRKSTVDIHVANLAETIFPAKASPYGWPFSERHLREVDTPRVSVEILRTRAETAQLGDLYLFWLALDGINGGKTLTLSWIAKAGNELRNPSSLLTLIAKPRVRNENIVALAGGLQITSALHGPTAPIEATNSQYRIDNSIPSEKDILKAAALIDRAASSAAIICPRRFAIQWALGPSASYQSAHLQSMLYGNLIGTMHQRARFSELGTQTALQVIVDLVSDLWRHLTPGQRTSSRHKAVVKRGGAKWQFIFSLNGNKTGSRPVDVAYQTATGHQQRIHVQHFVGHNFSDFLPEPGSNVDAKTCNMCPVAPRCATRVYT